MDWSRAYNNHPTDVNIYFHSRQYWGHRNWLLKFNRKVKSKNQTYNQE